MARARFGLLDAQFLKDCRHRAVDVLGAVVRVKPLKYKRKLFYDQLQYWQQKCLANTLHTRFDLPLAHLVNTGDVIHAFDAIKIALVDGVDAHKSNPTDGSWYFAYSNGITHRISLGENHPQGLIARAFAQVVQVRNRQACQPLIACIAIDAVSTSQKVPNGRAAYVLIGLVHLGEQCNIDGGVFARKRGSRRSVAFG